jgi:hypothetical protein
MFRTIAAAGIVFAFAAFALQNSRADGRLEEPILLLFMGSLFLLVGKLFGPRARKPETQPELVQQRQAA